ncbi:MAG: sortase [Firmicutes bacterium]|nr:sortase [Bacillota bacterium]
MKAKVGKIFISIGILLIAAAIILSVVTILQAYRAEKNAQALLAQMESQIGAMDCYYIPDYVLNPDMEMPTVEIDGELCIGILEIPSIERKLPVISDWEYDKLRIAPCRYSGSAYKGDLIIAAHNYDAHFGQLTSLDLYDKVLFTDASGNKFSYEVVSIEVLEPEDVEEMKAGEWDLTLFTCDSSITKRIAVRCMHTR